jgi:phospholipid/cholesterol/gamma-HCH transport system substrate-binding protein
VKKIDMGDDGRTDATIELGDKYAPLPEDSRAILRQKTLLGETYVELTPGTKGAPRIPENGTLATTRVAPTVELDEILRSFDKKTREGFQVWQQDLGAGIEGHGQDFSDALGSLQPFAQNSTDLLKILNSQQNATRQVIKNTGVVFAALNQRYGQLQDLIRNSQSTFSAIASQREALAQTFEIFPTFLDESRTTMARLERFSINTHPLVNDLKPVADDLGPTITDLSKLAPDLETLFRRLGPVIDAAPKDLPQAARFLRKAQPLFEALHVFLPELNPIISYANYNQLALGGFVGDGAAGLYFKLPKFKDKVPRYMLCQAGVVNPNSLGVHQTIPAYDRGNAYQLANALKRGKVLGVVSETFSCNQDSRADKTVPFEGGDTSGSQDLPPCFVQPAHIWGGTQYPRVSKGKAPLVNSPTGATPPALPSFTNVR